MKTYKPIDVPFHRTTGAQAHSYKSWQKDLYNLIKIEEPFEDVIYFQNLWEYSSCVSSWNRSDGRELYMSFSEFQRCIPFMVNGILRGKFFFKKQGAYYSVTYCDDLS